MHINKGKISWTNACNRDIIRNRRIEVAMNGTRHFLIFSWIGWEMVIQEADFLNNGVTILIRKVCILKWNYSSRTRSKV